MVTDLPAAPRERTHPGATYRLQLGPAFTFDDAAARIGYLASLGITDLYLSPVLEAVPGSEHGYDVVDPTRVRAELGGEAGFGRLADAALDAGLGIVLDVVPNHLGIATPHNPYWWDALRRGPDSPHAAWFDVDWDAAGGRVVLPLLGDTAEAEMRSGALRLGSHAGEPCMAYHGHRWPLRGGTDTSAPLPEVLAVQHYELVPWHEGPARVNYRRFLDIAELAGVRVEDGEVFRATHARIIELARHPAVTGLRIDHPDGLADPLGYARRLRAALPTSWVVFENLLDTEPDSGRTWPVDGAVGYGFLNDVLQLFVDPAAEPEFTRLLRTRGGTDATFAEIARAARGEVADELFGADVRRLAREFRTALGVEVDPAVLRQLLIELPPGRTHLFPGAPPDDAGRQVLAGALARTRDAVPAHDEVLDPIGGALAGPDPAVAAPLARLQQLATAVTSKSVEDTAYYRHRRLLALNEIGGDPDRFGAGANRFHRRNAGRQARWPRTMTTTSTHDTKRSGDVRARLAVLSELPALWADALDDLARLAEPHRDGRIEGDFVTLVQTLVGAWPIGPGRLSAYLVKAAREAGEVTSWYARDHTYERALERLAVQALADEAFVARLARLMEHVVEPGRLNALSQTLLRLTSPGVPDTYRGDELWDLSLVDPDNRRPVDFDRRAALLRELDDGMPPAQVLDRADEGLPKLWVTSRALRVRRRLPGAFGAGGDYTPLEPSGDRAEHAVCFVRGGMAVTIAPRLVVGLGGAFGKWDWAATTVTLPAGPWHDVMSGRRAAGGGPVAMAELLAGFPVALLTREEAP